MAMIRSSGTSSPASMMPFASRPSSVPRATCERSMSPVESLRRSRASANLAACVPFPAPGGPISRTTSALDASADT